MATRTSAKNSWRFETPEAMHAWGQRLATVLRAGDVVALVGPLGTGKTTLVQGIMQGFGYRRGASSPTFALANEYRTQKANVYHMDMYRLSSDELRAFPLEDYFEDGLSLIEWGDRVAERWPSETLQLRFQRPSLSVRVIQAVRASPVWRKRLQAVAPSRDGPR